MKKTYLFILVSTFVFGALNLKSSHQTCLKGNSTLSRCVNLMPFIYTPLQQARVVGVYIGAIDIDTIKAVTKKSFLASANSGVRISSLSTKTKVIYTVNRFHLAIKIDGKTIMDETINSSKFPPAALKVFKDKSNYVIEISEIYGTGPEGEIRTTGLRKLSVK